MNEQQNLLNVIWDDSPALLAKSGFSLQGINIYRRNLIANAERALRITFPTIFALLDSDISEGLVKDFLKHSPPIHGDWAQWGEIFSDFIRINNITGEHGYLADCAKLDWHIHCALQGKDQVLDQGSLQRLSDTEPETIQIILNANVTLLETPYPINDIYQAHHHSVSSERESAMKRAQIALSVIDRETAESRLSEDNATKESLVMVYRPEYQPKVITLTHSDAAFMLCLRAGKSLSASLDTVSHYNDFSFEKWLVTAITQNLIYTFKEI